MHKSSKILLILVIIALIGVGGYMVHPYITTQKTSKLPNESTQTTSTEPTAESNTEKSSDEPKLTGIIEPDTNITKDESTETTSTESTAESNTEKSSDESKLLIAVDGKPIHTFSDTITANTKIKQGVNSKIIEFQPAGKIIDYPGKTLYSASKAKSRLIRRRERHHKSFTINHTHPKIDIHNEKYAHTEENGIKITKIEPVSTFSIDVDTASYSNVRSYLEKGYTLPKDSIRIEEMINYFSYNYPIPETKDKPFAVHTTLTDSPWKKGNQLLHIGIKGFELQKTEKKPLNLVLLIDTSGSMYGEDRIGLLQKGFNILANQLTEKDTLSIVTYAGDSRVALEPTKGSEKQKIKNAINELNTGGGTWGAGGLKKAYDLAKENYNPDAINRILLGTDGDFNIGTTDNLSLEEFVKKEKENGIYLSVLSVGRGNYNDSLTQAISQAGNGMAYYLDSFKEAKKVLLNDISKTIFPIANDVKIQVEFNPAKVAEYRLIGYETRALNQEDFNNDKVDAGEIGSGHSVTAIYELTPVGSQNVMNDELRYAQNTESKTDAQSNEYAFVKIRYKLPNEKTSLLIEQPVKETVALNNTSDDVRFSIAVAGFAQNLKDSKFKGEWSYDEIISFAKEARGADEHGYRNEFIELIDLTKVTTPTTIQ